VKDIEKTIKIGLDEAARVSEMELLKSRQLVSFALALTMSEGAKRFWKMPVARL